VGSVSHPLKTGMENTQKKIVHLKLINIAKTKGFDISGDFEVQNL
jgi:hypothetical protein